MTLPFPEAGIRLIPQNSLGLFANTMTGYREKLQEAARELAGQYDTIKQEAQRLDPSPVSVPVLMRELGNKSLRGVS